MLIRVRRNGSSVSRHADRLFARIRSVIKDRCADPDCGPAEVAAEIGISLRFRDYAHFSKRFWRRFGHAPGINVEGGGPIGNR
jgi:hypothetical protein